MDKLSMITLLLARAYTDKKTSEVPAVIQYKGVTTTALSDGATTNPITINGSSYTAVNGDTVFYNGVAYTFDGTVWQETVSLAQIITALEDLEDQVGDLSDLTTETKTSVVAAINELVTDLGAITDGQSIDSFSDVETALANICDDANIDSFADVVTALGNKVDKVQGKGLSANDYTNEDKAIVGGVTTALAGKVDKVEGKGLSENDYTDSDKAIVGGVTAALATKQNATDNNLTTTDKTTTGAINELKSGLTDLSDHVDGDATTYPYADVITINDAVPANLADCSVKVEPVQDLHGFDHPWVGGAGKNKLNAPDAVLSYVTISKGVVTVTSQPSSAVSYTIGTVDLKSNQTYICSGGVSSEFRFYLTVDGTPYGSGISSLQDTFTPSVDQTVNVFCAHNTGVSVGAKMYPMIRLSTETDATFAPYTNICPISGHTEAVVTREGVNLFESGNSETVSGIVYTKNADGSFTVSGTRNGSNAKSLGYAYVTSAMGIVNVSVSGSYQNVQLYTIRLKDANGTEIKSKSSFGNIDLSAYPTVAKIGIEFKGTTDGAVASGTLYPMVVIGETATSYEPYKGQQYTLALGDTIYGGTVDFDSGVMTANYVRKTFDENVVLTVGTSQSSGLRYADIVYSQNNMGAKQVADNYMICSSYNKIDASDTPAYGSFRVYSDSVAFLDEDFVDVASAKAKLNGVQLVYELATPFTVQLTPEQIQLLQGTNTLYASTGDISVTVNGVSGAIGGLTEDVAELQSELDEQATTHVVLNIPANTYNTREAALTALYTAYNTLSSDKKRRAYLIWGDTVYRNGYMPNGYFSAIFPRWDDDSSAWISQIIIIDLLHENMLTSLLGTSGTTTTNLKTNTQDVNISLCY